MSLFCYALLCVQFSFAIILKRKKKAGCFAFIVLQCIVIINVMCRFLTVPWVGVQGVIVVFPDHTHLLFSIVERRLRNVRVYVFSLYSLLLQLSTKHVESQDTARGLV